jgi:endoglycosylceramidase
VKLAVRSADAQKVNVPLIISEFGACMGGDTCIVEITGLLDAADSHLTGWAYWQYKKLGDLTTTAGTGSEGFYNDDGSLQGDKVAALARPYLPNTQGTLLSVNYNRTTSILTATYEVDTSIEAPTVVYFNQEYTYNNGVRLSLNVNGHSLVEGSDFDLDGTSQYNQLKIQINNP